MKRTHSKDGTRLAYDETGDGPPLIFITGATCFRTFEPVLNDASVFAHQFTVYNYDRRGRGDSGNTLPYSIERELEDIDVMIDAAGGKANLYGHSSGAILALEAAMRLGDKVEKIIIYDAPYANNVENLREFEKFSLEIGQLLDRERGEEALIHFLKGIGTPIEVIDGMFRQSPHWSTMIALAPTLAYDTMLASQLPPIKQLARVTAQALMIVGEKSPADIHDVASQLKVAIPNAELITLTGQDHMPDPEAVLSVMSRFIKI
ncbi:alpha/beta hydrolase [Bacillaceae bacterium SIJ1]|uniref:alpha/beta fold hydrolase n=1 Tax=Litoribacterium kuwaitense TaxID=1398745 RepID=UPI0013EA8175|nr:alpha/beta hydrolase [Litoribacterium kuwaitense]NGP46878.1 alpha/beta hydrolase [Litoribacterium kuwaitense]